MKIRMHGSVLALLLCSPVWAIPEGPEPNTPEWYQREASNYAKVLEADLEQAAPGFQQRLHTQSIANELEWAQRAAADPSWLMPTTGNTNLSPLCTSWSLQSAGDPFRYPGVDPFYDNEGEVIPFVIYDAQCARISDSEWRAGRQRQFDGVLGGAGPCYRLFPQHAPGALSA